MLAGIGVSIVSCSKPKSGDAGSDDVVARTPTPLEQTAIAKGVTVVSTNEFGVPRMLRSVAPAAPSVAMAPKASAEAFVASLEELFVGRGVAAKRVDEEAQPLRGGSTIISMKQRVDGIPIHQGDLRVMLRADGAPTALTGTVYPAASKVTTGTFRYTANDALSLAIGEMHSISVPTNAIVAAEKKGDFVTMTAFVPGVHVQQARAKQVFFPTARGLEGAWSVEVFTQVADEIEAMRYIVSASSKQVLKRVNLKFSDAYVYRAFADANDERRPFDGPHQSFAPHPSGMPDGSFPDLIDPALIVMDSFNGPGDPWLAVGAPTTTGNNVDAYADLRAPFGFGEGDLRPEVRFGTLLNFKYDFSAEPLANRTQSDAATTNLFYQTNWLHDWYYDSGFTEATGNAQAQNFGRGGVEGDVMEARAQAGALDGFRNNAFVSVPEDGLSPAIHMFLWDGLSEHNVTIGAGEAIDTAFLQGGPRNFDVSGQLTLVDDGSDTPASGCQPIINDIAGKIAVVELSPDCLATASYVQNAQDAGAIAVLVIPPFDLLGALPGHPTATIPALAISSLEAGATVLEDLAAGPMDATLHRASDPEPDGDFSNGIIAHEWGHYFHLRLASCENRSCGSMSEGWGDFVALHLQLRPGDDRDGAYTAGGIYATQALIGDPAYFGIRRFPYSIDRTKNDLSLRHIADDQELPDTPITGGGFTPQQAPNSEVHNAGEVWSTLLWDVYNALIDNHGYDRARRLMSDYAVAGLLMTPPDASFIEGRDGLLAAASAIDTEDMVIMAAAFAGRGAGSCAVSPPKFAPVGAVIGVVESRAIGGHIEMSTPTLTDDGISCDEDGYLDPGEQGIIRFTIANTGILDVGNVAASLSSETVGVELGEPVIFGTMAPFTSVSVELPVTIAADAPVDTMLNIEVVVAGKTPCSDAITMTIRQRLGVDDVAGISTTDTVETFITPWSKVGESAEEAWARAPGIVDGKAWLGTDLGFTSDTQLESPVLVVSADEALVVAIDHRYSIEGFPDFENALFDGGVIEVSKDGGASWQDVTEFGVDPGYIGPISVDFDNPLAGRMAFSGESPGYPDRQSLSLDFGNQFAGQNVMLRFRLGTDFIIGAPGWEIDNIAVSGITNRPFPAAVPESDVCEG